MQMEGAKGKAVATSLVLLTGLGIGCATLDAEPAAAPERPATDAAGFGSAADRAEMQACYAAALPHHPGLSVHTIALYFARDGKVVFADVELPDAPELARCLSDALVGSEAFPGPPVPQLPGAIASGGFRIDLGPPLTVPAPALKLAEVRARERRVTLEALRQGALRENDPIVQEMRNPPPVWPTAQMRAELEACYRETSTSYPGLVLHRSVGFLARGGRVLLADVSIPEAPELRRCVVDRIVTWSSPFSNTSETVLSGFFMHLGGPEELPDAAPDLAAELARRDSLVARALELGLMSANDPLIDRVKPRAASGGDPSGGERPGAAER